MKNILLFIPALNPGGSERVMVTLANNWSKKYNVSILTLQNTNSFYQLNENIIHVKMGISIHSKGIKRLLMLPLIEFKRYLFISKYIKQNKFDFILSFTTTTNLLISCWKIFHRNCCVFLSERADPLVRHIVLQKSILFLYRFVNCIICQNFYVKEYFKKNKFKMPLPILPNPVNFQDVPIEQTKNKKREIVTVGRLTEQKNHKLLIDAFSEISNEYPEYILKIYGIGNLENELKKQIKDLKLENKVFLMGTKKRVMFDVQQSDIFVLSSNFEGFPNVLIEAMACGMPVISSDFATGIARQLIKNGENGFLFPVGNKDVLVNALKDILNRKDKWNQMGKINKEIAKQYKAETVAKKWLSTINDMLSEKM